MFLPGKCRILLSHDLWLISRSAPEKLFKQVLDTDVVLSLELVLLEELLGIGTPVRVLENTLPKIVVKIKALERNGPAKAQGNKVMMKTMPNEVQERKVLEKVPERNVAAEVLDSKLLKILNTNSLKIAHGKEHGRKKLKTRMGIEVTIISSLG